MSVYRMGVWFIKGMKEYTKNGYLSASKHFNKADLEVDCTGRSYMITGANSGIGKVVTVEIAKRGGTVHMVCRNKERGEQAQTEVKQESGNENVHLHLLDMSKPREVSKFAQEFQQPLHVLINNAGCMVNERQLQEDELEINFATNTLGTFILTEGLIPTLLKEENARVILVSSGGMLVSKLDSKNLNFENMQKFDGTIAYSQNKRQQIVLTEQYAKKHPTIHFSSMHPGWADTPAVRSSMPDFHRKMENRLRTAEQGADTLVWLAISDAAVKQGSGLFFQDRKAVPVHLPLAWTKSTPEEEQSLLDQLTEYDKRFKNPASAL